MKKKYKIKYKILVAGMYPVEKEYSINEFTLKRNIINKEYLNKYMENELIYVSPLIGFCCYNDTYDNVIYLTFEKEKIIELEVNEDNIRESIEKQIENCKNDYER